MGIQLILIAGLFIALSNLCMRKSVDAGGSSKAFLVIQLFLVFLVAILLNPVRTNDYHWSSCMVGFGIAGGIVLAGMMACLGKAVELGPPGLSFAFLNAATVMPIVVMTLVFGDRFGFFYKISNAIGSLIVIAGLFWAGYEKVRSQKMMKWLCFALAAFFLHVTVLVFMQWRSLFLNFPGAEGLMLSFDADDARSQWFMPAMFFAATLVQILIYAINEKRFPLRAEWIYGFFGGLAQGIGTFFLIQATEVASSLEHAIMFPIFAVSIIVICNLWGQWLYKEKVNWKASALCMAGILIGSFDWSKIQI
jgi:drug/metabolite transporter (DMT)-like permease